MEQAGVPKLYEPSPTPILRLFVAPRLTGSSELEVDSESLLPVCEFVPVTRTRNPCGHHTSGRHRDWPGTVLRLAVTAAPAPAWACHWQPEWRPRRP